MNYSEAIKKIENVLTLTKFATLATANKVGEISASQVCIVNDGLTVYVQTDKTFEKIKNIQENQNIALNLGAYYFKGKAKILNHPSNNELFIEKIKQKHPETYQNYTNLPNEVLVKIDLTEAKIWGGDNSKDIHNQETILVVDLKNKTTKTIICDKM